MDEMLDGSATSNVAYRSVRGHAADLERPMYIPLMLVRRRALLRAAAVGVIGYGAVRGRSRHSSWAPVTPQFPNGCAEPRQAPAQERTLINGIGEVPT
jgi:hypothetical protein